MGLEEIFQNPGPFVTVCDTDLAAYLEKNLFSMQCQEMKALNAKDVRHRGRLPCINATQPHITSFIFVI